uniref:CSON011073 protein n=1 Tax=Culicoides sonorensis TaxID=179676 RepID=A0A336LLF0_CULSO
MSQDSIDKLYANYDVLSDALTKGKIADYELEFKEILNAVKGNAKEKKLAAQFIPKFFKHFPSLSDTAIDRQLDLCEDEDGIIRRQAIKDLPNFCKDTKEHTPKIADILSQLLVSDDPLELQQVHLSLSQLAKYDVLGTLSGIFSQIAAGDEATRSRSFQYLSQKFMKYSTELITKEIETFIVVELKKILQDVTADEFHMCMAILAKTKLASTVSGHQELVKIAVEQAELDVELSGTLAAEDEVIERFIFCATEALPYLSNKVESTQFVKFMCDKLLPISTWNLIGAADDQSQTQLRLLKVFAELCTCCGTLEKPEEAVKNIYTILQEYMPLPPLDTDITENPSFQFSHAECLLYALHAIGKQSPEFLTFVDDAAALKDFKQRIQYLARGTQGYIKKLQEAIKGKTPIELKSEENQIKITALKTTSNISTLIRDLFHSPPLFKAKVNLSWLAPKQRNVEAVVDLTSPTGGKRHAPITFEGSPNTKKSKREGQDQKYYAPPSGKYSAGVKNYSGGASGNRRQGNGRRSGGGFRSGNKRFGRY